MKLRDAQALLKKDIQTMTLEQLQRHKVKLIDAWRESRAAYGMEKAINDGFYKLVLDHYAKGFAPSDIWLTKNLEFALDKAQKREEELL